MLILWIFSKWMLVTWPKKTVSFMKWLNLMTVTHIKRSKANMDRNNFQQTITMALYLYQQEKQPSSFKDLRTETPYLL